MISLRKYLSADEKEALCKALLQMGRLFLQAVGSHAMVADQTEYESYLISIRKMQEVLRERPAPADVLVNTGIVVRALEDYNQRTTRLIRTQSAEYHSLIGMLARTVAEVSDASEVSLAALTDVERQLQTASGLDSIRAIKAQLARCVERVREESKRQRENVEQTVARLRQEIQNSHKRMELQTDMLSGLPNRRAGELALETACVERPDSCAAILAVEAMESINARFGRSVGDEVLLLFCQNLGLALQPGDEVFRWSGPGFLTLVRRTGGVEQVRQELRRLSEMPLEINIDINGRPATLPVTYVWAVFPTRELPAGELIRRIDEFLVEKAAYPPFAVPSCEY